MTKTAGGALLATVRAFAAADRGNVALIFGLSLIPLIGLVGLGTDYGVALTDKSKLDNATDAAALAAVSTAKAYVAANPNDPNMNANAIAAGLAQASSTFTANTGNLPFGQIPAVQTVSGTAPSPPACGSGSACIYLTRSSQTFLSTASYATATQNHFGQIFGSPTISISGTAVASANIPSYLDFYLLVDVSGSMGLPATPTGQATLAANNGGCQFACHFPGQTSGYTYANNNGIVLRAGAVNTAVCGLLTLAGAPAVTNQYRVGIYPFIDQMATLASLTYGDSLGAPNPALQKAAGCGTYAPAAPNPPVFTALLDTGVTQLYTGSDPSTGTGSGGTHFEGLFATLQNNTISSFGAGASSSTSRPFVFLITDGMQNSQHYATLVNNVYTYPGSPSQFKGYNAANWDGSSPAAMNAAQCAALKNAGVTISVLYIPYQTLTVGSQNQGETIAADNAIPNIPTALQSCATTGFFYTANSPTDITNALANMFNQAVQVAHLQQ